jgi:hypothetical protein
MLTSDIHQHHHLSEALHKPGSRGGSVCTDNFEQRRRRGKKVAQRVSAGKGSINDDERQRRGTKPFGEYVELCRPYRAQHVFSVYPGLTPWATFLDAPSGAGIISPKRCKSPTKPGVSREGRTSR